MSPNDSIADLESRISSAVERQVRKMRDELLARVGETEAKLEHLARSVAPGAAPAETAAPAAAEAPAAAGGLDELFEVAVAMDRAASQPEVLATLLEGVGRFANRSALFLTQPDGLRGWGGFGFELGAEQMQQRMLEREAGQPWVGLEEAGGCRQLDADGCAAVCDRLGAPGAAEGLLAPFVLRDRTAAALYADRDAGDPPLDRKAIQLLTNLAALSVEALVARQRSQTATLHLAEAAAAAPAVVTPEEAAVEPEEVAVETEQVAAKPGQVLPEQAAPEPEEAAAEPVAPPEEPAAPEPPPAEVPAEAEAESALAAEPEPSAAELSMPEVPDLPPAAEPAEAPAADELATAELGELELEDVSSQEFELQDVAPAPAATAVPAPPPPAPEPVEAPPAPVDEAAPAIAEPAAAAAPEPAMPPPPAAQPLPAEADGGSTQVQPPTDHEGPGWAFTGGRTAETGNDAQQEEARRLARLLVTEIKLYNEEQVEEGRRTNDIYSRLKEDIDRSRQIFNERVDPSVREHSDYFHEEMVRILAGGKPEALGI